MSQSLTWKSHFFLFWKMVNGEYLDILGAGIHIVIDLNRWHQNEYFQGIGWMVRDIWQKRFSKKSLFLKNSWIDRAESELKIQHYSLFIFLKIDSEKIARKDFSITGHEILPNWSWTKFHLSKNKSVKI